MTARPDTWMPFFIGDYLADTMHLSTQQHGAYLLLIFAYWRRGGPLPADDAFLAGVTKCSPKGWGSLKSAVIPFFTMEDGLLRHKRIDQELLDAAERLGKQRSRTAAATAARKTVTSDVTSTVTKTVTTNVTRSSSPSPKERIKILGNEVAAQARAKLNGSDHPPNYADPAVRHQRRDQKIINEINLTLPAEQAVDLVTAYMEREPEAIRKFAEIDRTMRARDKHANGGG